MRTHMPFLPELHSRTVSLQLYQSTCASLILLLSVGCPIFLLRCCFCHTAGDVILGKALQRKAVSQATAGLH